MLEEDSSIWRVMWMSLYGPRENKDGLGESGSRHCFGAVSGTLSLRFGNARSRERRAGRGALCRQVACTERKPANGIY